MDFKSMTVRDFFEVNGGKELCETLSLIHI